MKHCDHLADASDERIERVNRKRAPTRFGSAYSVPRQMSSAILLKRFPNALRLEWPQAQPVKQYCQKHSTVVPLITKKCASESDDARAQQL